MQYYILDATAAGFLSIVCAGIGSIATMIGWKITPVVVRYLQLIKLKYFALRYR